MKKTSANLGKVISLIVRLATLLSKFILLALLAKTLTPKEVGLYGLIAAAVGYTVYILGLEFYCYTTRELASSSKDEWTSIIKNHSILSLAVYAVAAPIIIVILYLEKIPPNIGVLSLVIIIIEHVGQEQIRFLIATSRQLEANALLFVRTSSWIFVITPMLILHPESRSIETVLLAWAAGGIISLMIGKKIAHIATDKKPEINYAWIKKGLAISIPILISTLSARGIFTFDRYLIEALQGLEQVAPYVLFIGIANAMISLLDSGVYAYHYPSMIKFSKTDPKAFKEKFKSMLMQTLLVSVAYSALCMAVIETILKWIDKEVYTLEISSFYIVLFAFFINALSMVFHYSLYSLKKDKIIFYCNISTLPVFLLSVEVTNKLAFDKSIQLSMVIVFLISLLWKLKGHFLAIKCLTRV